MKIRFLVPLLLALSLPLTLFAQDGTKKSEYPMKIDDYTTLKSVKKENNIAVLTIVVNHAGTTDHQGKVELDKQVKSSHIAAVCANQSARNALSNGNIITSNFHDEKGNLLLTVVIDNDTCTAK